MKQRELAACAVMTALLIASQYVMSFVVGVELVTALFAVFCFVFGVRAGILTGIAFSLLRCLLFGFMPNVVIVYLIYYTIFACALGLCGKKLPPKGLCSGVCAVMAAFGAYAAVTGLPVSALYLTRIRVMLGILSVIFTVLAIFIFVFRDNELATVTAVSAMLTVMFTLLDDVVTPLTLGYSHEAAAGYFYSGFLAMLPQTICAAVSVFILFRPLKRALENAKNTLSIR